MSIFISIIVFHSLIYNSEIDEIRRREEAEKKKEELYKNEIRRLEEDQKKKEEAHEMRRKILQGLSPGDFEETHARHFKKRFENTGQWLLDDSRFRNWRDEAQSGLLWCHGARKSYLVIYLLIVDLY